MFRGEEKRIGLEKKKKPGHIGEKRTNAQLLLIYAQDLSWVSTQGHIGERQAL